jgi:hypothetical protein
MERGDPLPRSSLPAVVAVVFSLFALGALIVAVVHAL